MPYSSNSRSRVFRALLAAAVLAAGLAAVVANGEPAAAVAGGTDPASAPLVCNADFFEGIPYYGTDVSPVAYGSMWVAAGATVDFTARGEIYPSRYVGSGRGEYTMDVILRDPQSNTVLYSDWNYFAMGIQYEPYEWVPFSGLAYDAWKNNTGQAKQVQLEIWARQTYAGGGIRWGVDTTITGTSSVSCRGAEPSETFGPNDSLPGQCESRGSTDRSVDTLSGNEHWSLPGVAIPGRGPGLQLAVAYNSLTASVSGPLGHGWRHSYAMNLVLGEDGKRTVHQEGGATVPFTPASGGGWVAPGRFEARLTDNGDGTWLFERNRVEFFTFDSTGRLTSIKDRNGYETGIVYDAAGLLDYVEDEAGRRLDFSWSNGRVSSITDPLPSPDGPRTITFGYDANGDLVNYTDIGGGSWVMTYDTAHRLTSARPTRHTDPAKAFEWHYDPAGRVDWEEDPAGRRTSLYYDDPSLGATRIVGPDGDQRVDYYSSDGCRTKVTVGYGTTEAVSTTISYDPATFMPTTVTDGRGNDWVYSYTDPNNPRSATAINDPLGRTSQFTFNPSGQLLRATDASGVVTALEYDANGNLEKSTAAVGRPSQTVTDIVLDPGHPGDAIAVIDGRGKQWTATYDPVTGSRLSSTDPEGNTTAFEHNAIGWLTGTVAPAGNVAGATAEDHRTHFQHNAYGDVTTTINPADEATVSVYDAHRNLISVTDPDGDVTQLAYSDADQLATTTSGQGTPEAATTTYSYFPDGALESWAKDGSGTWSYAYDSVGRLITETDPNGNSTAYRYDGNGNLTSLVQPGGDCGTGIGCITYGYDLANQLTSIDYSDPDTADVIGYGYDQAGRRTTAQLSGGATSTWAWTPLGQLASHTDSSGRSVDYGWDAAGNLESIWYPGQTTPVTYSYDEAGRMNSVTDWLGNTTSFAYDSNSNLTSTVFPAGTGNVDSYTYDRANRLGTITWNDGTTALGSVNYTRAPDGQVSAAATTGVPLGPQSFGYDARDQLTDLDATTTYRYDTAGNPTTVADDALAVLDPLGTTTTLADGRLQVFDPAQQLCWSSPTATSGSCDTPLADATTYAYDTRGNRTDAISPTGTSTSYDYDQANRLTRAQLTDLSSTDTTQFTYHPDGLRATKTGTRSGTTQYTWDTAGGLPLLLTETTSQGDTHLVYGPGGMPIAQIGADSGVGWLHHDHLGSTRLVTDHTGGAIGAYTYDPYGQHSDSTGTYDVLLDYAGQYTDAETGLQYLRARYYDPATSQFLTRDPLVGITHEPYTYASNNPTNLSDPTGLCPVCLVAVIVAFDAAATAWDAYDTYKTVTNGCASGATKAAAGGLFIAGLFLPGNLGWADNAARHAPQTAALADDVPAFARSQYGRVPTAERVAALERAPTCPYCGTNPSSQVDHITALRRDWGSGGWADDFATRTARVNDPLNLVGACASCNAAKGARALGEGPGQWWPSAWPSGTWWPFGP